MKYLTPALLAILVPISTLAENTEIPAISSSCQIRLIPGGRDGSTVEHTWKITAKTTEDQVLSVEQLTRNERPQPVPTLPDLRGYKKFMFCKAGSLHEKEIKLEVDQAPDGGERAYWFEGFLTSLINEDIPLPEAATVAVTTRQISDEQEKGHLVGVTVSQDGREISRHFIFISYISPADLQKSPLWAELTERERELRDGKTYQDFTDAKSWKPRMRRFIELEK